MAIDLDAMKSELEDFFNEVSPYDWNYEIPPTNAEIQEKVGDLWETIFKNGFLSVSPGSSAVASAAQTLGDYLRNNPASDDMNVGFYAAVQTFYSTIMGAMSGYSIGSLPPLLVLSAPTSDKEAAALAMASQILSNATLGVVINTTTMVPKNLS